MMTPPTEPEAGLRGLVVDFGGVLTTSMRDALHLFAKDLFQNVRR